MTQPGWFTEQWATEVRDAARKLVRLYAEAIETVDLLPRWIWRVRLSGLRGGMRPLIVVKPLLRDAVANHVRRVLTRTQLLQLRGFMAGRPLPETRRRGRRKAATPAAVIAKSRQEKIAILLEEAARDVKGLLEVVGEDEKVGRQAFAALVRAARRWLPVIWAGVVISQFDRLSGWPQFQPLAFFLLVTIAYHLAAALTLPLHDAAERKHVYMNGYLGAKEPDGLNALVPPATRREADLFKLLGPKPPIVISWEIIIPVLHYALMSVLLVIMLIKLPFTSEARAIAGIFAAVLGIIYFRAVMQLWALIKVRYRDRSVWEVLAALLPSFDIPGLTDESERDAVDPNSSKPEQK
jgi:hypothetical protein